MNRHRQWAPTLVDALVRFVVVALVWRVQRVASAWHSAARGGAVAARHACHWAKLKGHLPARVSLASDGAPGGADATGALACGLYADEVLGLALAGAGVYVQLRTGFLLPPALRLALFPLVCCESLLGVLFLFLGG